MRKKHALTISLVSCLAIHVISSESQARHHRKSARAQEENRELLAPLVSLPKDQEVCFAPDEPCDIKLVKFVSGATQTLDIAIYDLNLDQLVHQILVLNRTIRVRVVVDRKQAKGEHSLVSLLVKAGAQVRYGHQRGIMHDKFTIVDDRMIETGSFNYTNHASIANQENQIYLSNSSIVSRYAARFEKMWAQAKPIVTAGETATPRPSPDQGGEGVTDESGDE